MVNQKEIYLRYPSSRDVVFVLGAGASQPAGVPLQRDILPTILSGSIKEIKDSSIGEIVTEFIEDNFFCDVTSNNYPDLEAVFGFIDYFLQQNESLSLKYPNSRIWQIKEYLIKLVHFIVNHQTEKGSKYYHLFWQAVQKYNSNISICTLNYDTLLEHSFEFLFKKFGYIDYCTHFMNYDNIKEGENIEFDFWINPREPVSVDGENIPFSIKLIKIHGSLNWKFCNCCNQTLLTPWDRKIDLQHGKFLGYTYPEKVEYEYVCPLDGTEFNTLIMAPSFVKPLKHPVISQLLSEASREIRAAKKVVFVGYSLSETDIHIKALFKKHLDESTPVTVILPRKSEEVESKYYALTKNIDFVYSSFEDLVRNEKLMKELLT
ncbi:SIR2 family protein [Bacteroidota bacterium]